MILTERPRLQPRTLSPINEGQFFLQLDPAARLDPHSAFTIVAIQRKAEPRGSVASILPRAKCLTLRPVGSSDLLAVRRFNRLIHSSYDTNTQKSPAKPFHYSSDRLTL